MSKTPWEVDRSYGWRLDSHPDESELALRQLRDHPASPDHKMLSHFNFQSEQGKPRRPTDYVGCPRRKHFVVWENIYISTVSPQHQNGRAEHSGGVINMQYELELTLGRIRVYGRRLSTRQHTNLHKWTPRQPRAEPELPEAKDNEVLYTPESWQVWTMLENLNLHTYEHTAVEHVQWSKMTSWKGIACAD